jgi:hypothetical protein
MTVLVAILRMPCNAAPSEQRKVAHGLAHQDQAHLRWGMDLRVEILKEVFTKVASPANIMPRCRETSNLKSITEEPLMIAAKRRISQQPVQLELAGPSAGTEPGISNEWLDFRDLV